MLHDASRSIRQRNRSSAAIDAVHVIVLLKNGQSLPGPLCGTIVMCLKSVDNFEEAMAAVSVDDSAMAPVSVDNSVIVAVSINNSVDKNVAHVSLLGRRSETSTSAFNSVSALRMRTQA